MTPDKIKALRASLGLSQERMSRGLGLSLRTWQDWEAGAFKPTTAAVILLKHLELCTKMKKSVMEKSKKARD